MTDQDADREDGEVRSENLRAMQVKVRGDYRAGKSELIRAIARLAGSFGMQCRVDADGHNLTLISSSVERIRLFEHNRRAVEAMVEAGQGVDG